MNLRHSIRALLPLVLLVLTSTVARASAHSAPGAPMADLHGTVTDSASGSPIGSAEIAVTRDGRVVAATQSDAFGRFLVHNLADGTYKLVVHFIGFRPAERTVVVRGGTTPRLSIALTAAVVTLSAVQISAQAPIAVDTRTGDQTYTEERAHEAPTTSSSQIIQQSVAGAVRAPSGEVHIRGQHAEYTYYVDGVPVPSGISGSLNELFDPKIVNNIKFKTGGWDAEYGNKNAAVIDVTTRVPSGGFHLNASAFDGAFNTNGQSLSASTNSGKVGFFASFSRQGTDMRKEPVAFDTVSFKPYNFHNHGEDLFGFAKLQISASNTDLVNLEANWSRTKFQVPFDTAGGVSADDNQEDMNAFVNLGWRHRFGDVTAKDADEAKGGELFAGLFHRTGSLKFVPGLADDPQFSFYPDPTVYSLRENRSFTTDGLKLDYSYRPDHEFEFKTGVLAQFTNGSESFSTFTPAGKDGPASNSALNGSDIGGYAQIAWSLTEQLELRAGARYDAHTAPFAGTQSQLSPRIKLNYYLDQSNTFYAYYGRLFVPTNVEDLRAITSVAQGGVPALPTLPERDHFFEAGLIHRFPQGVVAKLSGYHKESSPGIDDNTVPGSAIVTSVNIEQVRIDGLEAVLEVHPEDSPLSANLNVAISHAYGSGTITGGFFPDAPPKGYFDLDHDQRLSVLGNVAYTEGRYFVSATGIYGSGLTNGVAPSDCACTYGRGLFDFNSGIKVKPNFVVNASAGLTFVVGETTVRPEVYVDNLFDSHYLLKGTFFSGASVGRPRSVQLRVNVGI
ncbi:MAG: TonB-dependent receptor [Gemmatimonadetes bacterium]|nr:TonB-dependent receptor [Gemmatimonadota bacterium]